MKFLSAGGLALALVLATSLQSVGQIDPVGPPAIETTLSAEITAPETVEAGRLVRLRAVCDGGRVFAWTVAGASPEDWEPVGAMCLFATPKPGRYVIVLAVAGGSGESPSLVQVQHVLTVTGSGPTPKPDDPTPQPDPGPKFPPGKFNLAQISWDAMRVENADRATAAKIGDNYAAMASKAAGLSWTAEKLIEETRLANRRILKTEAEQTRWREILGPIGEQLAALIDSGAFGEADIEAHRAAWQEIATGLQAWGAG